MIDNFIVKEFHEKLTNEKLTQEKLTNNNNTGYYFLPFGLTAGFNSVNPFSGYMKSVRSALYTS